MTQEEIENLSSSLSFKELRFINKKLQKVLTLHNMPKYRGKGVWQFVLWRQYITLVPKMDEDATRKDTRPVSLIHMHFKKSLKF